MIRMLLVKTPRRGIWALHEQALCNGAWQTSAYYELANRSTKRKLKKFARDHLGYDGRFYYGGTIK